MAADSPSDSIFDFAGKKPTRPPLKKRRPTEASAPVPAAPTPVPVSASTTPAIPASELEVLIESVVQKRNLLTKQIEDVYKRSGHTRDSISDYLNDPTNFSEVTWQIVQDERTQLMNKINKLAGRSESHVGREKKKVTEEKKRKGKTLGARRNWLSM